MTNTLPEDEIDRIAEILAIPVADINPTQRQQLNELLQSATEPHLRRANYLNDALTRAAEFMLENKLLPPDTTTRDGIKSYFLNDARFKELKQEE